MVNMIVENPHLLCSVAQTNAMHILIIRREGGKETQIKFNYKEYTSGDNPGQNILLKPGDTIVVP